MTCARASTMFSMALLVGAVVNLAVAWLIAWRTPAYPAEILGRSTAEFHMLKWPCLPPPGWKGPLTARATACSTSFGFTHRIILMHGGAESAHAVERQFGWPVRALTRFELRATRELRRWNSLYMEHSTIHTWRPQQRWWGGITRHGWADQLPPQSSATILPTYPLIWGFAGNTLIYAACLVGPWLIGRALRRRLRTRRGLCGRCGYQVAGLAACPECGMTCAPTT